MKRFFFYILLTQFLWMSCGEDNPKNIHNTALPHAADSENVSLTAADKRKLASANGKKVESIHIQDIEQMFDAAKDRLHIFSFWKLDCEDCITTLKKTTELLRGVDGNKFRLIFINLDQKSKLGQVNSFIREENIFAETYYLESKKSTWFDGIHKDWKGELPATFFVQEDENLSIFLPTKVDERSLKELLTSLNE